MSTPSSIDTKKLAKTRICRGASERVASSERRISRILILAQRGLVFSIFGLPLIIVGSFFGRPAYALGDLSNMPQGLGWVNLVVFVVTIVFFGLCEISKAAVDALRGVHVRQLREAGSGAPVQQIQTFLDRKSDIVPAIDFASGITRLALSVSAVLLVPAFVLQRNVNNEFSMSTLNVSLTLLAVFMVILFPVAIDILARAIATVHPARACLALSQFIRLAASVCKWPATLARIMTRLATNRYGITASTSSGNHAEDEIKTLVESAQEAGEIEVDEKELLHSVFDFNDTVVREVMTPRVDVDAMSVRSEPTSVLALIQKSGHSRIPLYEETDDAIVGIIHAKDLLMAMLSKEPVSLRSFMRPPLFVPENKNLHDLLQEFRLSRSQLAVVQDEFGGTSGIVTIEDIVEELVGDIVDEYDTEEPEIVENESGLLVEGKTHLDDVNNALGSPFESGEFDTIGGYVFGLFGRQPRQGEVIEDQGYSFRIASTDGRRIIKIQVSKSAEFESVDT